MGDEEARRIKAGLLGAAGLVAVGALLWLIALASSVSAGCPLPEHAVAPWVDAGVSLVPPGAVCTEGVPGIEVYTSAPWLWVAARVMLAGALAVLIVAVVASLLLPARRRPADEFRRGGGSVEV